MAHSDAHDPNVEHTGHGGHHVFEHKVLVRTFALLVGLTILTVVLALFERGYVAADTFGFEFALPFKLGLGKLSIVVALGIAAIKGYFVASYFMGLKYEGGTNVLVFVGSLVFLAIFFVFTWFDTGFRDTFEELSAVPADVLEEEAMAATAETDAIQAQFEAVPLVEQADTTLFGRTAPPAATPPADPTPAIDGDAADAN